MFVLIRHETHDNGEDYEASMQCSLVGTYRFMRDAKRAMREQWNDRMAVDSNDAEWWNDNIGDGWHEVEGFLHEQSAMVNVSGSADCTEWFILDSDHRESVWHSFEDLDR